MKTSAILLGLALLANSDSAEEKASSGSVNVTRSAADLVISTPVAEFRLLAKGELVGSLLTGGRKLSLQEPSSASEALYVKGGRTGPFALDLAGAKIDAIESRLGAGKRVEIRGRSRGPVAIETTIRVEVYADFPSLALSTASYRNVGSRGIEIERLVSQAHRLNAALAKPGAAPFQLWSFQGASTEWGQDEILPLAKDFARPNVLGSQNANGSGGGVPLVAFWTASVGLAIGHLEATPVVASLPVKVENDGRIAASLMVEPRHLLAPGEEISAPRSFLAVYSGDFYEPLRLYSQARQREGWSIPAPSAEAYKPAWCGWGYEFDVTPAQMLGTIPMLKELGIEWATLDDRWFANYGDWPPRPDTFPGESIRSMVDAFHRDGIRVQIWWLPLGAEDGEGEYPSHKYAVSDVVARHPEWLVLDKDGRHARMVRNLAVLCPALPEVREHHRRLTERFVREWGFDGHKLDNAFTVPPCYNPAHHHRSPDASIQAVGEVYRTIFETTRALKPESVTQICPCGTPPNVAWLPAMDQAVTADPVGAMQVRRRIKMYKALLGPQAAVYGDHVELSEMTRVDADNWTETGRDFASTIGAGGIVGTKFSWPDYGGKFKGVLLDDEKRAHWKKWIGLANAKQLQSGTFLNLYVHGYDVPEGYAIAKDGRMYYAFFAPDPTVPWKGRLELRGLKPGRYEVRDYAEGADFGVIDAGDPFVTASFTHHLLLEAAPR